MSNLIINTDSLTDTEKAIAEFLAAKVRQTEEEKKKTWKPKINEKYLFFNNSESINTEIWTQHRLDENRYSIGNCFKTKEDADFAIEKLKVIAELKRFAEKHNPPEFKQNSFNKKWILVIRPESDKIEPIWVHSIYPMISFATEEIANAAINKIGIDRLKKYYLGISTESEV